MPDKKFELGDYVEVRDRIKLFYELFAGGRLVTSKVKILTAPDGTQRVIVTAKAYRTVDDPLPGVGTSWLALPGATPYTRGSEVENAETSAWGRAIGALGILIDKSIASANEVENKRNGDIPTESADPPPGIGGEAETLVGRISRRGIIRKGSAGGYQLEPRQTPDGFAIGFRLEVNKDKDAAIPQVLIEGRLGVALTAAYPDPTKLIGTVATVAGILYHVKGGKGGSWYRLHVDRFENADWILPADPSEPALPEPPDDVPLLDEAPTEPLGLVS